MYLGMKEPAVAADPARPDVIGPGEDTNWLLRCRIHDARPTGSGTVLLFDNEFVPDRVVKRAIEYSRLREPKYS
jgi:hypothetical protein